MLLGRAALQSATGWGLTQKCVLSQPGGWEDDIMVSLGLVPSEALGRRRPGSPSLACTRPASPCVRHSILPRCTSISGSSALFIRTPATSDGLGATYSAVTSS